VHKNTQCITHTARLYKFLEQASRQGALDMP